MSMQIISAALGLITTLIPGVAPAIPAIANPVVNLGYAQYKGAQSAVTGVTTWYGIQYAASPTGENRWRAPFPIEQYGDLSDATTIDATIQGPFCIQGIPGWFPSTTPAQGNENCLTVDVLVPNMPANSSLPVMVEFHGGGYNSGSASDGPGYAMVGQAKGNLIFVSAQYRLGALGFLSGSEVKANGTANAGLLDQRLALQWVQNHIASFGGDPTKVTIHGASAGGGSVSNQLILYGGEANAPFRAAIAEYPWWQPYHNDTVLEFQYRGLLQEAACTDLACLRQLDIATLSSAIAKTYTDGYNGDSVVGNGNLYGYGDFYYGPSVDGTIIQDLPSVEFAAGPFSKVPFLTDREGYEGVIFTNPAVTTEKEVNSDLKMLWPQAPQSFFDSLYYDFYPPTGYNSSFYQLADIFGDAFINCGTQQMASAFANAGLPVWKMIFNDGSQIHGATVPYLFGKNAVGTVQSTNDLGLSLVMKDWFISFVTNLDPNAISYSGTARPNWPQYSEGKSVMSVNYTMLGAVHDPDDGPRCAFMKENDVDILN